MANVIEKIINSRFEGTIRKADAFLGLEVFALIKSVKDLSLLMGYRVAKEVLGIQPYHSILIESDEAKKPETKNFLLRQLLGISDLGEISKVRDETFARVAYKLANLLEGRYSKNSVWRLCTVNPLKRFDPPNSAVVMEYVGRQNTRFFPDGSEKAIREWIISTADRISSKEHEGNAFNMIVDSPPFERDKLDGLLGEEWHLKPGEKAAPVPITTVYFRPDEFHELSDRQLPEEFTIERLTESTSEVEELFRTSSSHSSYHKEALRLGEHFCIKDKTGKIVAIEGIVDRVYVQGKGFLSIIGDLVVSSEKEVIADVGKAGEYKYRGKHLTSSLRSYVIQSEIKKNNPFLFVADIHPEARGMLERRGAHVLSTKNPKSGQNVPLIQWWCLFEKKDPTRKNHQRRGRGLNSLMSL